MREHTEPVWRPAPRPNASEAEIAWAAGLFEGEGCIYESTNHGNAMRGLTIRMTDEDTLRRFHRIVGVGRFSVVRPNRSTKPHYKQAFSWHVGAWPEILMLADAFMPWLGQRRQRRFAELLTHPPRHPNATRKTHCDAGHPLDGPDADVRVTTKFGKLQRVCRVCARKRNSDYRSRYARLLADQEPELAQAFEMRELRA